MEKNQWKIKKLGDCCEVNPHNSASLPEYFHYIDLESVVSGKLVKNQFVAKKNAPSRAQRLVLNNDVLYQTVRPYQMNNYIFKGKDNEYVASTGYALLRAKENIDADFIYYIIHTHNFVSMVLGLCTGTSYPAITPSLLNKIDIPIPVTSGEKPSLPAQRRIAEILSSVDKVISSTESLIEKYKAIKMGLLNDLLQPKEGWRKITLDKCCDINPRNSTDLPENFFYIDLESVVAGELVKQQFVSKIDAPSRAQRLVLNNDVLYQTVRPYQMNNYIFKGNDNEYVASTGYALLRAKENIDADFIYYIIHKHDFVSTVLGLCTGTSYPAITPSLLNVIEVFLPYKNNIPDFIEQRRIASILQSVDSKIETEQKTLEKYISIKKGLMKDLFTGE